jgi:transcriptional antiterminator/mannitol/fructose-specific phosphotransferase system IIA component
MNDIDSCLAEIIRLMISKNGPVSAQEIGNPLGLSPRSVRYHLKKAKRLLDRYKIKVVAKPNIGIQLSGSTNSLKQIAEDLEDLIFVKKEERLELLKIILLTSRQQWTFLELASYFSVSRSTIVNEIYVLKIWFKSKGITLNCKQNFGSYLNGDESIMRDLIVQLIFENTFRFHLEDVLMKQCFMGKRVENCSVSFVAYIQKYFSCIDFIHLNNLLNAIFEISIPDTEIYRLILSLAVQIERILSGFSVGVISKTLGDFQALDEYYKAKFFCAKAEEFYRISFTLDEISHTTKYLISTKAKGMRGYQSINSHSKKDSTIPNLPELMESFINCLSMKLHPSLIFDIDYKNNLLLHLELFEDHKRDFVQLDPRLETEIFSTYPDIYRMVEECFKESDLAELELPNFEISLLTIHTASALERIKYFDKKNKTILLVCNAGTATANLLKTKISTEFSDVIIGNVISYKELLNQKNFDGIDFIISTFPLRLSNAPPVLIVSPLLQDKDVVNLHQAFNTSKNLNISKNTIKEKNDIALCSFVELDLIELKVDVHDRSEAIEKAGNILLRKGYVEEEYVKKLITIIEEFGPYMVVWPGIALLHAPGENGAKKLRMSLITLENKIDFGHEENDPVDIVICLSIPYGQIISLALDQLNELLTNEKSLETIRKTINNKRVYQEIVKYSI